MKKVDGAMVFLIFGGFILAEVGMSAPMQLRGIATMLMGLFIFLTGRIDGGDC